MYSNYDQGRIHHDCKFHDPRGKSSCARAWPYKAYSKIALFFFNIFSQAWFRQTQYIVIITNEKSTKIVNFNDLRARVSCARAWTYKSYSENKVIQIEFQISGKDVETPNLYSPVVFLFVQQQKN